MSILHVLKDTKITSQTLEQCFSTGTLAHPRPPGDIFYTGGGGDPVGLGLGIHGKRDGGAFKKHCV